jgi:hypothetical protein
MKEDPDTALEWFERAHVLYQEAGEIKKAQLVAKNIDILRPSGRSQ